VSETVIELLDRAARENADHPALGFKVGNTWESMSWSAYREEIFRAARGFLRLGLAPGKGVAILGFNRPQWFISELAAVAAGGAPAGLYTTLTPDQCHYVADHCEAQVAVVENEELLQKLLAIRGRLPHLKAIVLMVGESAEEGVLSWDQLLRLADEVPEAELETRIAALRPEDLCTLIYTSGTTGPPKAVMLSHHNIVWTARRVVEMLDLRAGDRFLSYLPLSHIAEKMVSLYGPLSVGGYTWFAESLERMPENLREVRPHVFFGVPRVWEKIQAAIEAAGADSSPIKRRIVAWARAKGLEAGYAQQGGGAQPRLLGLAERLVFSKVRRKLGLDRARMCATSAAPISRGTLELFLSLGIPIYEVYGMSECTGPATISMPDRYRTGKAGYAIPGTELKITERGEIWIRGPHVFMGYYRDPEATRETLDQDGWLHSGDVGEIDDEGFLEVTDRLKEIIITSGGKNIAPQTIETRLKTIPAVAVPAVVGDRRNYLTALLTLDPDRVPQAAEKAGSPARELEAAACCPVFRRHLERQVERINATLAGFETIKKFAVLPGQFTPEGGELTPTMKLKRRVILQKYAAEIEELYAT
jgi:long-subunit acyl-CoA synthetase (AMP-forming)